MNIEFLSTVAVIAPDPPASRTLYVDALGLPLESQGGEYHPSEQLEATSGDDDGVSSDRGVRDRAAAR